MEVSEPPLPKKPRFRLLPRTLRGWFALLAVLFMLSLIGAWGLSRATPPWYDPMDPTQDTVIDQSDIAGKRLLDLHNVVQRIPQGQQTWTIRQNEINSLLAIRFAPPLNVDGTRSAPAPAVLSDPVVTFTPGKVTISARCTKIPGSNPKGGVASIVFNVDVVPGGDGKPMGLVKVSSVWIGLLPVPTSLFANRLKPLIPAITAAAVEMIELQWPDAHKSNVSAEAQQIVEAVILGQPFPLEYTLDRKSFSIKTLHLDQDSDGGVFTLVLDPATPALPIHAASH